MTPFDRVARATAVIDRHPCEMMQLSTTTTTIYNSRAPPCRHDATVRRVLAVLFPECFSSPRRRAAAAIGLPAAAQRRPLTPTWIADAVELIGIKACERFGETTIELQLVTDTPPLDGNDDRCSGDNNDSRIALELLGALRAVLANQRLHHAPPDEDEQSRVACNRAGGCAPIVAMRLAVHRYWHRTVYWLCDVLALMCSKFTVVLKEPPPALLRCQRNRRYCGVMFYRLNLYLRLCCLRWRVAVLRRRARGCVHCAHQLLGRSADERFMLKRLVNYATKFVVASQFVRLYRRAIAACPISARCSYHRDHRSLEDYERAAWSARFALDLRYEGPPPIQVRRLLRTLHDVRSPLDQQRRILVHLGRFACDVAGRLSRCRDGTVSIDMTTNLFESARLLLMMVSLFGGRAWPRVTISYDADQELHDRVFSVDC